MASTEGVWAVFFFGLIIGFCGCGFLMDIFQPHYKDGQIDAITGKIQFELVTMPDSTRVWKKIKE